MRILEKTYLFRSPNQNHPQRFYLATERIKGFDTLRFFLALWVVFGHFGFIPLTVDKASFGGLLFAGIYDNSISGLAAVIVFFVIKNWLTPLAYQWHETIKISALTPLSLKS